MTSLPRAAVLVLNYNGRQHLETCLASLAAVEYPSYSVMVVDNGSSDDSREFVRTKYPAAGVLALGRNRGFATAYNIAVTRSEADVVVLLNNDTRVDRGWLTALMTALERNEAAAAASCLLNWQGTHVDFAGGLPTFLGHAWQADHGRPIGQTYEERPLLFGCGGALAIRRSAFQAVGGFDEDYFAYFEDLDLGWRMSLAGLRTVLAPAAVTYHRVHGTAGGWALSQRLRLYERNALFTIYKNLGDEALRRVLPAALTLTIARALGGADLDGRAVRFGVASPTEMNLPATVIATLLALEEFALALPVLRQKRARIQAARVIDDERLFALFPQPLKLHEVGDTYVAAARTLIRDFGIAELFGEPGVAGAEAPALRTREKGEVSAERRGFSPGVTTTPLVSVIVLTASGPRHLPDCLASLRAHDWPADATEVIVVDNGSEEDPSAVAERYFPGARVVRNRQNLGFAAGNNAGARAARGELLVFLNDDTRVSPGWLHAMWDVARRRNAASVGALLVDWPGERVDFAGGLVNLEGRGYSLDYDAPLARADRTERPILFGCGAAVLFRRDVFFASGGWDEPTFAYYEDVEFGWRLWMLGHDVWLAPGALVHHRHHGTSGEASPARTRAFERNALRLLYGLVDDERLARVLPAAVLLSLDRALLSTPFGRADEGVRPARSLRTIASRLRPHTLSFRLKHALSRRGARKHYPVLHNLRHVGARGLAAALVETLHEFGSGAATAPSAQAAAYRLEDSAPSRVLDGHAERLPADVVARLLGLQDFIGMLPELSQRRAWLQARRQRRDEEILRCFGDYWLNPVPSPRLEQHIALRDRVLDAFGLGRRCADTQMRRCADEQMRR